MMEKKWKRREENGIETDEVKNKKYPIDDRKKDVHLLNIISFLFCAFSLSLSFLFEISKILTSNIDAVVVAFSNCDAELFNIISNCCVVLKNVRTSRNVNTKTWRTAYEHVIA